MTENDNLIKQFEAETGKNAIWRGQETKNFIKWKKEKSGKHLKTSSKIGTVISSQKQISLNNILAKLTEFEQRLIRLEETVFSSKKQQGTQTISDDHFLRIINAVYNSIDNKMADFVQISTLTEKIKEYVSWSTEKIHHELYRLFTEYKVDLQPGKGEGLESDGKLFVWFKLK